MVFTLRPFGHTFALWQRALALVQLFLSSGIVRFVQGGVVKTFRWATQINRMEQDVSPSMPANLSRTLSRCGTKRALGRNSSLCNSFVLQLPTDILSLARTDFPRSGPFPDSPWSYRVHGIGIDIVQAKWTVAAIGL